MRPNIDPFFTMLFLFGALCISLAACATLNPGADPLVVRTEQVQAGADATVDFVLNIDQSNRGFWLTNAPAFHNFCEYLRTRVPNAAPGGPPHDSPRVLAIEENVQRTAARNSVNSS